MKRNTIALLVWGGYRIIWIDKKGVRHSDYHASCVTCAICMDCKHFKAMEIWSLFVLLSHKGIPEAVWTGTLLHTMPISGDHGLQYEKAEIEDTDLPELLYVED